LLFVHHKGLLKPPPAQDGQQIEATGDGPTKEEKAHPKEAASEGKKQATDWTRGDNLIVGSWVAFTALCLGLRRLRSAHENH
jgi:hypothetical protein